MSWQWPKTDRAGLARYVLSEAAQEFDLGINRNDLSQDASGRRMLVDAIYFSLQSKQLRYALEKYHPDDAVQLIRSPDEILKQKEGTCLDLALLFCGVCLGYELLPLMILIEGHALAAVSLNYDLRSWDAYDRKEREYFENAILKDVANLRRLVAGGAYLAVECTGFAQTEKLPKTHPEGVDRNFRKLLPFQRALEAGQEQLNQADRPFIFALDIPAAHDLGFRPGTQPVAQPETFAQPKKEVNVGIGLEAEDTKIEKAIGVVGSGSNDADVNLLNKSKLNRVEIGSLIGVDNSKPEKQ